MSCFTCLLAFLAALVFGSPELGRVVRLDIGLGGACVSLPEPDPLPSPGLTLGVASFSLDRDAGLRVDLRV